MYEKENNTKAIRFVIFHIFLSNCCVKSSRTFIGRSFHSLQCDCHNVFQKPETSRLLYNYFSFELLGFSFKLWIKILLLFPLCYLCLPFYFVALRCFAFNQFYLKANIYTKSTKKLFKVFLHQ